MTTDSILTADDMPLTQEETRQLEALMDKVSFPTQLEIFFAWVRNFYVNAVELALIKNTNEGKQILLIRRPADDPFYANQWHMPGSIVLPGKTFAETVARCIETEVLGIEPEPLASAARFRRHWDNIEEVRGHTNQFLHTIELTEEQATVITVGGFFPFDNLPTLIKSHTIMIEWLKTNI